MTKQQVEGIKLIRSYNQPSYKRFYWEISLEKTLVFIFNYDIIM